MKIRWNGRPPDIVQRPSVLGDKAITDPEIQTVTL